MMKRKYFALVMGIFALSSSCSDFLDLKPKTQVSTESFYVTAADFETALMGDYAEMQNLYNISLLELTALGTDNVRITWSSPTTDQMEIDESRITASNGVVQSVWTTLYAMITRSNQILAKIAGADIDEETKSQYSGEALFLRAYAYFDLVRLFGPVQVVQGVFNSPAEIATYDMSRKPVDEVYTLIIEDLQKAAGLLQGVENLEASRASEGAAKTLLGKVYLTRGQFDQAAEVLKAVIDAGKYSLVPDYQTLFTNDNNDLAESIFVVNYLSGNIGEGNSYSSYFTPGRFDMAIFPGNMQGNGRMTPTPDIWEAYEQGDIRREASIGDSILLVNGTYAKELYGLKFVDFTTGVVGDGGINFIPLRYADVLLMYAEALNATGATADAYPYINQVRKRAGLDGLAKGLTKTQFEAAVRKERRVEFFLEGDRWFTLVRTGQALSVMNAYYKAHNLSFSLDKDHLLMPVPLREITINPKLKQNEGY